MSFVRTLLEGQKEVPIQLAQSEREQETNLAASRLVSADSFSLTSIGINNSARLPLVTTVVGEAVAAANREEASDLSASHILFFAPDSRSGDGELVEGAKVIKTFCNTERRRAKREAFSIDRMEEPASVLLDGPTSPLVADITSSAGEQLPREVCERDGDELFECQADCCEPQLTAEMNADVSTTEGAPQKAAALTGRFERSNSCSQAELGAHTASLAESCGGASSSAVLEQATVPTESQQQHSSTTSASQENLARSASSSQLAVLGSSASVTSLVEQLIGSDRPSELVTSTTSNSNNKSNQKGSAVGGGAQEKQSASSRFFSSKLNTGSLWSLLSVGSNSSYSAETPAPENMTEQHASSQQDRHSLASGFFNRVNSFKRTEQPSSANPTRADRATAELVPNQSQMPIKRFRFNNVKYIGSAILHKNFTLPMLEWIAKDIKRQSVRGAQSTSQRQFNFPSREIVLEIQSNFVIALSAKDGHLIFKHPMHCISKYAQLQQDQTSFSYLIRDTKESPHYCHVFQAKSVGKVHDIFNAIREAASKQPTDRGQSSTTPIVGSSTNALQKSLSSEASPKFNQPEVTTPLPVDPVEATQHFEDSYQFEVMFVKKVKLQCRRVPASFVDDALETLKTFDVLKGGVKESKASQIKGSVGKRIISASVDERQEYDETCQSPTPGQTATNPPLTSFLTGQSNQQSKLESRKSSSTESSTSCERRGSTLSLHSSRAATSAEGRLSPGESRSCQQSPTKTIDQQGLSQSNSGAEQQEEQSNIKKHQSMDCLKSIADLTIKSAKAGNAPNYTNDFSPYNTISSNDLNERIAAIPVVSTSSVSLDHETRQRLARQVRETIMATAASIKKDVYASGDTLDSSSSSKALDSLSCTAASTISGNNPEDESLLDPSTLVSERIELDAREQRHSSSNTLNSVNKQQQTSNNFDLFRRASSRQVVKNRTMLLLIGKDELCTISIDKHQMLFSKSFSSIALCLQGNNNKDHFGLICRDSGKINPQAESIQDSSSSVSRIMVAREIMAALKQVIYNSQHNQYHGARSPYNPMNSKFKAPAPAAALSQVSPVKASGLLTEIAKPSLASKRGFLSSIDLDEAARQSAALDSSLSTTPPTASCMQQAAVNSPAIGAPPKNLVRSMFCDNCPLYWYHRLCCDIESLPSEISKTIILRRCDNSLPEKEQDELYSKFSEFNIDSTDEHNTIFMSLLRHLSERKQLKHVQTNSHQVAMAKNSGRGSQTSGLVKSATSAAGQSIASITGHQRSGSGSAAGSLAFVLNQSQDASSAAIDNLKRAKNSISVSIENMLKRRSSLKDGDEAGPEPSGVSSSKHPIVRAGSFRAQDQGSETPHHGEGSSNPLKRSQSTSDYSNEAPAGTLALGASLRDSISRTINFQCDVVSDSNPIVGLFRRRGSSFGSNANELTLEQGSQKSSDCLAAGGNSSPGGICTAPASPKLSGRSIYLRQQAAGVSPSGSSSSILSSVFWKKSIFDKVRRTTGAEEQAEPNSEDGGELKDCENERGSSDSERASIKRTSNELRALWRKAILEQITLIKMDKQNQKLLANAAECDMQRVKLNYRDVPYRRDVLVSWDKLLKQNPAEKVQFADVARLVRAGIPKQRRGSVWMFLMNQYQLRHGTSFQPADSEYRGDANQNYRSLLSQLSLQQHEIFVDIGRTFPSHPYYSQYLSIGQLSLFNLLKAYSLLDQQVGYCQGLSFVAGILLLHVDGEDEAFELMRHLLFNFGLRKQYLPSMNALHLQLYQLTRLLRDHEFELFNHFDNYDISPSLYAAPWFLTLFASQFPLGFVSRLLDLIFLIGIEAIFRVSLNLLANHRHAILSCTSLETTMDYMRCELVKVVDDKSLISLFDKSMSLDLRNKLIEYEIEYSFYCAEEKARAVSKRGTKSSDRKLEEKDQSSAEETNIPDQKHEDNISTQETGSNPPNDDKLNQNAPESSSNTSLVADATATVIIQHLLANNHLKSLRSNYSY